MTPIRPLDYAILDLAAQQYASQFIMDQAEVLPDGYKRFDRDWVMLQFYNFTFKDEFEYIRDKVRGMLGPELLADFNARLALLPARDDAVFLQLLEQKRPAGYIPLAERVQAGVA